MFLFPSRSSPRGKAVHLSALVALKRTKLGSAALANVGADTGAVGANGHWNNTLDLEGCYMESTHFILKCCIGHGKHGPVWCVVQLTGGCCPGFVWARSGS